MKSHNKSRSEMPKKQQICCGKQKFILVLSEQEGIHLICQFTKFKQLNRAASTLLLTQKTKYNISGVLCFGNGKPIEWPTDQHDKINQIINSVYFRKQEYRLSLRPCSQLQTIHQIENSRQPLNLTNFFHDNHLCIMYKDMKIKKVPSRCTQNYYEIVAQSQNKNKKESSCIQENQYDKSEYEDDKQKYIGRFKENVRIVFPALYEAILFIGKGQSMNRNLGYLSQNSRQNQMRYTQQRIHFINKTLELRKNIKNLMQNQVQIDYDDICENNANFIIRSLQSAAQPLVQTELTKKLNKQFQKVLEVMLRISQPEERLSESNLYKIQQIESTPTNYEILGGISQVVKVQNVNLAVRLFHSFSYSPAISMSLACLAKKSLKQNIQQKYIANHSKRFIHQIEILKYIADKSPSKKPYLLTYFLPQAQCMLSSSPYFFCTWQSRSLSSFLLEHSVLPFSLLLSICLQICTIILDLHRLGVVHRDLKPANFILNIGKNIIVKLIDFSQSMVIGVDGQKWEKQVIDGDLKVLATPLYCPLETSSFSTRYKEQGLVKAKIDNWSVGVLLFEVIKGYLPISYSSSTLKDIHQLWEFEFFEQMNQMNFKNFNNAKKWIQFLTFSLLKIKQSDRLCLQKTLATLLLINNYYDEIAQIQPRI